MHKKGNGPAQRLAVPTRGPGNRAPPFNANDNDDDEDEDGSFNDGGEYEDDEEDLGPDAAPGRGLTDAQRQAAFYQAQLQHVALQQQIAQQQQQQQQGGLTVPLVAQYMVNAMKELPIADVTRALVVRTSDD